jgi:hypothetical protein
MGTDEYTVLVAVLVVANELVCNGRKKWIPEFRLVNYRNASLGAVD